MTKIEFSRMISGGAKVPLSVKNWPFFYLVYAKKYFPWLSRFIPADPTIILRDGTRFKIRPVTYDRVYIISEIWLLHDYDLTGHDIQSNDTVIDLGAHIGIFSIYAARNGAKVISYEPFSDSYTLLRENIELNRLENNITPRRVAAGSKRVEQTLYSDKANPGANSTVLQTGHSIKVKTVPLTDIFKENKLTHCNLLKCDIEGAEYELLYNAPVDIFKKIDRIYLEWHILDDDKRHRPDELQRYLEEQGYVVKPGFRMLYAVKPGQN